ncbi:hypothetical protein [Nocardioides sp.]|uniref:hypothetical protein n=1 Tax=Nocardioides sp. TaxID=35761 RepID=UPI0035666F02
MAGGMGGARGGWAKRGSGIPLSERVRTDLHHASASTDAEACPARHCWVGAAVDEAGVKRPGLLVEWRQATLGWEGRVIYVAAIRPGRSPENPLAQRWVLVEEWLPAEVLTPI